MRQEVSICVCGGGDEVGREVLFDAWWNCGLGSKEAIWGRGDPGKKR